MTSLLTIIIIIIIVTVLTINISGHVDGYSYPRGRSLMNRIDDHPYRRPMYRSGLQGRTWPILGEVDPPVRPTRPLPPRPLPPPPGPPREIICSPWTGYCPSFCEVYPTHPSCVDTTPTRGRFMGRYSPIEPEPEPEPPLPPMPTVVRPPRPRPPPLPGHWCDPWDPYCEPYVQPRPLPPRPLPPRPRPFPGTWCDPWDTRCVPPPSPKFCDLYPDNPYCPPPPPPPGILYRGRSMPRYWY